MNKAIGAVLGAIVLAVAYVWVKSKFLGEDDDVVVEQDD